jgi:hypothetical protein
MKPTLSYVLHLGATVTARPVGPARKKFGKGDKMTETTSNPGREGFRRFALVLMVVLIAFGILELAGVVHV